MEIDEITEVEDLYHGHGGEPSLGRAHAALLERWEQGATDRETSLRLMFLSWYACSEPGVLTGLPGDAWAPELFADIFEHLGGEATADPEVMFVAGVMASSFPYCCGDEEFWSAVGARLTHRCDVLSAEQQLDPVIFDGRGAYGAYFAHMWRRRRT